jgi:flagellar protein FlgJ
MTQIAGSSSGTAALAAASTGAANARPAAPTDQRAALAEAAKAFEAIFTRQLLGSMRQASLGEDIAGSSGVDQFRELADARMADGLASKGGLGIASMILQQLDKKAP